LFIFVLETWVMDMRDVDLEIIYEPGKDEADPLDFLSRYPLPEKENDGTERVIKAVIHNEHAVNSLHNVALLIVSG
jgi:hypothetical protein